MPHIPRAATALRAARSISHCNRSQIPLQMSARTLSTSKRLQAMGHVPPTDHDPNTRIIHVSDKFILLPEDHVGDSVEDGDAAEHGAHEDHYDPPTGWLFGVKPGEKSEKEGWEGIFYWGFCGTLLLGLVGYAFKPDTSIQTWALEEARRRLEAEGILPEPDNKS